MNDFAGMLDPSSVGEMERVISDFEKKTTIEIAVVTIPSFDPYPTLEEYASELFKSWKNGK
ncbi:MAG TPA: TPM domain-containing protein, partial [Nitrospiria bacterium]|nr:TPM domain-containing protein [Nitrospiria bacterium]